MANAEIASPGKSALLAMTADGWVANISEVRFITIYNI
jgi:hypothetical protein